MNRGLLILQNIALLVCVLVIHESVHAIVARFAGIPVTEFSFGFGPVMMSWILSDGTRLAVRGILLGASVTIPALLEPNGISIFTVFLITVAGPVANLCIAATVWFALDRKTHGAERVWGACKHTLIPTLLFMRELFTHPITFFRDSRGIISFVNPKTLQWSNGAPLSRWEKFGFVNMALGMFNLLPIPPLDGGKFISLGMHQHAGASVARVVDAVGLLTLSLLLLAGLFNDLLPRKKS